MAKNIMIIGAKESFFIRVLAKKLTSEGFNAFYTPAAVNAINAKWESSDLITYYMETGETMADDVMRFLVDKMTDDGKQFIVIGDASDVKHATTTIPEEMIYKTFSRPLNNESFIATVKDLFRKIDSGEFRKSILIVDDDHSYIGLVREWLKDEYKVSMAASGLQAIKWLAKNKVDLILLDFEMPITSGAQVLEMLRSDEETKYIPVIFLTGKSDKESVMEVVALKPEGYLLKNISREELLEKIAEFFVLHKK